MEIEKPIYVACEGDGDKRFFSKLLEENGFDDFQVGIGTKRGREGFPDHFGALRVSSNFRRLRTLVVIADNDESPKSSFAFVQRALKENNYAVPSKPKVLQGSNPAVAIFMMPSFMEKGALETVLVRAVFDNNAALAACVQEFDSCIPAKTGWTESKKSKMCLAVSIAASCTKDPGSPLAHVFSRAGNPIPLDSDHYRELLEFFKSISGS